jgi:hypothetical protein
LWGGVGFCLMVLVLKLVFLWVGVMEKAKVLIEIMFKVKEIERDSRDKGIFEKDRFFSESKIIINYQPKIFIVNTFNRFIIN